MGLDLGEVRIGVALSDPLGIISQPYTVLKAASPRRDAEAIRGLVEQTGTQCIVVGMPLNREGKPGPQAEKVLAFIELLRQVVSVEIVTQDERFTTAAMQRVLIDAGVRRDRRKQVIDKLAAQQILQTYLDRQAAAARARGNR
jgi:putative Holliday junction resolvase